MTIEIGLYIWFSSDGDQNKEWEAQVEAVGSTYSDTFQSGDSAAVVISSLKIFVCLFVFYQKGL